MDSIRCGECGARFGLRPDGLFQCDGKQPHELDPRDIDLDGSDVWAVNVAGTLVIVADPAVSVEWAREALDAYLEDEPGSWSEHDSLRSFLEAVDDLLDAARVGFHFPNSA
jgi:hypothetical protein